ncbi:MAG: hypothetical protein KDA24_06050 [Deltaproteobacteria bacterium]|nr:hypothetical protein [Deltaproteobacteria bacterium]
MPRLVLSLVAVLLVGCPADGSDDDDTTASSEDRPCSSWSPAVSLATVDDGELDEISGLVASRRTSGVFWVHEDSGSSPVLTALDRAGRTLGTLTLEGVGALDSEDLALGSCADGTDDWCLVLGDFGDNTLTRTDYSLFRVREPDLADEDRPFDLSLTPEQLVYTYPEGSQNAEALVLEPDGVPVVITKREDGDAWLYRLPAVWSGPVAADRVATLAMGPTGGLVDTVTGSDLSPDGDRLLLRTYTYARHYDVSDDGLDGVSQAATRELLVGAELQGETIAWDDDERSVLHVGEAENATLWHLECTSSP